MGDANPDCRSAFFVHAIALNGLLRARFGAANAAVNFSTGSAGWT
jgi:hypothetical protein